jgi:AcrR family transcriptional regulator
MALSRVNDVVVDRPDAHQYLHTLQYVNTEKYPHTKWYPPRMARNTKTDKAIRDAAAEIRRETRAAANEMRVELGAAGRESSEALREAMTEVRAALRQIWSAEPGTPSPSRTSGGRPSRAERKELTRQLLLDAAIDVFAEKGYHGASLDDVADAAGFTKGAVYSNFTRKSDLFRALLEREAGRAAEARRQAIEATPLELVPDVAEELARHPGSDRDLEVLLVEFWLAAARDPSLRAPLLGTSEAMGEVLSTKLAGSSTAGDLDGHELGIIFDALLNGLTMHRVLDPDGAQPELLAKALRKLLSAPPTPEA